MSLVSIKTLKRSYGRKHCVSIPLRAAVTRKKHLEPVTLSFTCVARIAIANTCQYPNIHITHTHIYIYIYTYVYIYICTHTHICIYTYVYISRTSQLPAVSVQETAKRRPAKSVIVGSAAFPSMLGHGSALLAGFFRSFEQSNGTKGWMDIGTMS